MNAKEKYETRSKDDNKKFDWEKDHDSYLRSLVEIYGVGDWNIVADCLNNKFGSPARTARQCHDRWKSSLNSSSGKQVWSDRERYLLLVGHKKFKNRWSEVALMLHKHSSNMIKNRFYTLFRKIKNKIKNADYISTSKLDLLEIYYILSLIEEYHKVPPEKPGVAEQSDKNYAHKLVQQIDRQSVAEYRAKVFELHQGLDSMDELFDQYAKTFELKAGEKAEECNQIDMPESDGQESRPSDNNSAPSRITLPLPESFVHRSGISVEEKDVLWRSAFQRREPLSGREECKSVNSLQSVRSASRSVDCSAMRDDEGLGFSQFTSPFENPGDRPTSGVSTNLLPTLFQNFLEVPSIGLPALGTHGAFCDRGFRFQVSIPIPVIGSAFKPVGQHYEDIAMLTPCLCNGNRCVEEGLPMEIGAAEEAEKDRWMQARSQRTWRRCIVRLGV